jgi:hypothetical protein
MLDDNQGVQPTYIACSIKRLGGMNLWKPKDELPMNYNSGELLTRVLSPLDRVDVECVVVAWMNLA